MTMTQLWSPGAQLRVLVRVGGSLMRAELVPPSRTRRDLLRSTALDDLGAVVSGPECAPPSAPIPPAPGDPGETKMQMTPEERIRRARSKESTRSREDRPPPTKRIHKLTLPEQVRVIDRLREVCEKVDEFACRYADGWGDARVAAEIGPHVAAPTIGNVRLQLYGTIRRPPAPPAPSSRGALERRVGLLAGVVDRLATSLDLGLTSEERAALSGSADV